MTTRTGDGDPVSRPMPGTAIGRAFEVAKGLLTKKNPGRGTSRTVEL